MIAVIGDFILDEYVYGEMSKISSESPIPIFQELYSEFRDGGSGNVAANLRAFGEEVKHFHDFRHKPVKRRYVCNNHIVFRADIEEYLPNGNINFDLLGVEYCIISDYGKGFIHLAQDIVKKCKDAGCFVIVDPKKELSNYAGADIVKLNKKEFVEYTGHENLKSANEIRKQHNFGALVITLSEKGIYLSSNEFEGYIPCENHQVADVTGAGDVFIAAMTHFLNVGNSLFDACQKANILAAISVTKFGTYVLTEEDIKQTKTIFTNGCFDILHKGHIEYLKKSKSLGAKLIVGLNSDSSIKKLKGNDRPFISQEDRKAVLESLDCVDEVIIFDDETPYELIKKIKPDIITKGGDYTRKEDVVGHDIAEIVILPFIEGYSTTRLLENNNGKNR